jgi:hypothetical protein
MAQDVVELLGHDDGESDFRLRGAAHRALIDQIIEEDDSLMARYLEDGADPSPQELHAPFEKALRAGHLIPSCSCRPAPAPACRNCSTRWPNWHPTRPKATRRRSTGVSQARSRRPLRPA